METICIKKKVKEGSLEAVRKWFQTLRDKSDEVLQSLENEGVLIESAFLDKQGYDYYVIYYYMKAKSLAHAREVSQKSTLAIDKYHKECSKKHCEDRIELEPLIDFHRF
jgi:Family of unknown function (DUF6176)